MRRLLNFLHKPWPFAVIGAGNILFGIVQDNPFSMLVGMFGIVLAITTYEENI